MGHLNEFHNNLLIWGGIRTALTFRVPKDTIATGPGTRVPIASGDGAAADLSGLKDVLYGPAGGVVVFCDSKTYY